MLVKGKLNLNRHPSEVTNGDWTDAVNVVVSEDNVIQNEPVLKLSNVNNKIQQLINTNNYIIKHIIPCKDLLVFFIKIENNSNLSIIVYDETKDSIKILSCELEYNNGEINTEYNYVNGGLVITLSEYNVDTKVPLRIIDFDKETCIYMNPIVHIPEVNYVFTRGSAIKGWYYVFIQYKIKENNYTKWFNTNTSFLLDTFITENIYTYYATVGSAGRGGLTVDHSDHSNKASVTSIISIKDLDKTYNEYRLGFIIKNKTETKYYITNNLDINDGNYEINFNNLIEYNNELTINYDSYYNIKAMCFYKNKTYIANYEENIIKNNFDYKLDLHFKVIDSTSIQKASVNIVSKDVQNKLAYITVNSGDTKQYVYPIIDGHLIKAYDDNGFVLPGFVTYFDYEDKRYYPVKFKISQICYVVNSYLPSNYDDYIDSWETGVNELYYDLDTGRFTYTAEYDKNENIGTRPLSIDVSFLNEVDLEVYKNNKWQYRTFTNVIKQESEYQGQQRIYFITFNEPYSIVDKDATPDQIVEIENSSINLLKTNGIYPLQYYNFYIHFVDRFGNISNGYKITKEVCSNDNIIFNNYGEIKAVPEEEGYSNNIIELANQFENKKLILECSINNLPNDVGYFISYEKFINEHIITGFGGDGGLYNAEFDYLDKIKVKANSIDALLSNGNFVQGDFEVNSYDLYIADSYNNLSNNTRLHIIAATNSTQSGKFNVIKDIADNKQKYRDYNKTLIPCSKVCYSTEVIICNTKTSFNSYDFYARVYGMLFDNGKFKYFRTNAFGSYNSDLDPIALIKQNMFKTIPSQFLEIEDLTKTALPPSNPDDEYASVTVINIINPRDTIDLFKLVHLNHYEQYPIAYTNYNEYNTILDYPKTIRRSKLLQDESKDISNRFFNIEDYKSIIENKGNIIKLTAVGNIILCHTENSLFMFDGTDRLKSDKNGVGLADSDIWDVMYKEITTENLGKYGIIKSSHAIVGEFGYVYYSKHNNSIIRYDNNQLVKIDDDIKNFLLTADINDVTIIDDYNRNRLLFIFICKNNIKVVISYNYKFSKWVSLHTNELNIINGYNTVNKLYLLNKDNKTIYNFDTTKFSTNASIDILFNSQYEAIKFIEYIKYKLYKTTPKVINDSSPVEGHIDYYAGNAVRVFTEFCDTNDIDLSEYGLDDKTNSVERYDEPYFRFGNWHINNLRNNKVEEGEERNRIYGNWFVVRIKFGDNKKVELESIDCKFSPDIV